MRSLDSRSGLVWFVFCSSLCGCGSSPSSENDGTGAAASSGGSSGATAGGSSTTGGSSGETSGGSGAGANGGTATSGGTNGTAGTGASGGDASGGSPTKPPQNVLPCDSLPEAGTWEEITPAGIWPATSLLLDPVNSGTVYIGTIPEGENDGVYKSTDCGANWVHINTGENGDKLDGGVQWAAAIDWSDPEIVYMNAGYGDNGLFKSTNGGVDWADITPENGGAPGFVGNLQMDPDDPTHILTTWHTTCNGPNGEYSYEDQVGCFHESTDGGATWKAHYSTGTKWQPEVRVLVLHGDTWVLLASEMLLTRDGGDTWEPVLDESAGGHSSGTLSVMADGDAYVGHMYGMIFSDGETDGGEWAGLDGTGQWVGNIVESETTRYATHQQGSFQTSPITDGETWTEMVGSPPAEMAAYDSGHKLLYASSPSEHKVWRYVTE